MPASVYCPNPKNRQSYSNYLHQSELIEPVGLRCPKHQDNACICDFRCIGNLLSDRPKLGNDVFRIRSKPLLKLKIGYFLVKSELDHKSRIVNIAGGALGAAEIVFVFFNDFSPFSLQYLSRCDFSTSCSLGNCFSQPKAKTAARTIKTAAAMQSSLFFIMNLPISTYLCCHI